MNIDFAKRSIVDQIKVIAKYRGITQDTLREKYNALNGTNYSKQSFSNKMVGGRIRCDELQKIGEILGFEVKLELID